MITTFRGDFWRQASIKQTHFYTQTFYKKTAVVDALPYAQNIYLLKIHLNLFEIWNQPEILLSGLKIYLKHGPWRVVPCACIQVYHLIRLNTHSWHRSPQSMFEIDFQIEFFFQIWIKFSNPKTSFATLKKFNFQEIEILGISFNSK